MTTRRKIITVAATGLAGAIGLLALRHETRVPEEELIGPDSFVTLWAACAAGPGQPVSLWAIPRDVDWCVCCVTQDGYDVWTPAGDCCRIKGSDQGWPKQLDSPIMVMRPDAEECNAVDLDGDGDVDLRDWALLEGQ